MDGIVVGCDASQEWLLSWWLEQYRHQNQSPIAFADFGMSQKRLEWCLSIKDAQVLQITNKFPETWFHKPFALLNSPFDRSIWIDVDCEVIGNVNEIFEFTDLGFAVTSDPHAIGCSTRYFNPPLATGVVGVKGKPELLIRWTEAIANDSSKYRGDQECLNDILKEDDPVVIMPPKFQRLRLDQQRFDDTVIMHWTGPEGKKYIKSKMIGLKCLMATNHRQYILNSIPPGGKMFEWGSGGSTIWFLQNLQLDQHLTSIEEDRDWFNKITEKANGFVNHTFLLVETQSGLRVNAKPSEEIPIGLDDYIHPSVDWNEFDVILVDGVARGACLASIRNKVKPGVKIFIHDTNRHWYDWAINLYPHHKIIKADKGDYPPDLTEITL